MIKASQPSEYTNEYCCQLVGTFLQHWGIMESALNDSIATAFNLDTLQAVVVNTNIQFRDKIHITRTATSLAFMQKTQQKHYDNMLNDIAGFAKHRNMVAHDLFAPNEDGRGVVFFVVRAKGKITMPPTIWTKDDFDEKCDKLDDWTDELRELQTTLKTARLAEALIKDPSVRNALAPTEDTGPLMLRDLPFPQTQESRRLDTHPANPQKDDESPPESGK